MPRAQKVGKCDLAIAASASGTFLESQGPGAVAAVVIAQTDVASLPADLAAKAPIASPAFTGVVGAPTVDHGTQGGTIANPTPQTLWTQQPRDPAKGPWRSLICDVVFSGVPDSVHHSGYNCGPVGTAVDPTQHAWIVGVEQNYYISTKNIYTCEWYLNLLPANGGPGDAVRPIGVTINQATKCSEITLDLGDGSDPQTGAIVIGKGDTTFLGKDDSQTPFVHFYGAGGSSGLDMGIDSLAIVSPSTNANLFVKSKGSGSYVFLGNSTTGAGDGGIRFGPTDPNDTVFFGSRNVAITANSGYTISIGRNSASLTTGFQVNTTTGVVNFSQGPTAPTATAGTNTTQVATTAFVAATQASPITTGVSTIANSGADGTFAEVLRFQLLGNTGTGNWRNSFQSSLSSVATNNLVRLMVGTSQTTQAEAMRWSGTGAVSIPGSLSVGGGAAISKILRASAILDFPSVAAGGQQELTISATGATAGAEVAIGSPAALESGLTVSARVSSADTVKVRISNITGSPIDPASSTYRVTVFNP